MVDEAELHDLLAVAPSEFVAARNARVKALRAAGDREAATALAALRRIHVTEWAMNIVSAEAPDLVEGFADAAATVLAAQAAAMSGGGGGDLRGAISALRDRAAEVVTAVRKVLGSNGYAGAGTSVADVSARLSTIAGNADAVALLRRGLLGAENPGLVDPFASTATAPTPKRVAPASTASTAKAKSRSRRKDDRLPAGEDEATVDLAEERARRRGATDATRALEAARADAAVARRNLERAAAAVSKADRRVADAEAALAAARDAQAAANEAHADALARDAEATDAVGAAEAELAQFQS
jgi:hypothetical protein